MTNKSLSEFKSREQGLEDYKKIKEAHWWKLLKFPLFFCCIVCIQVLSSSDNADRNIMWAFFAAGWFEVSMYLYRTNKKLDCLYIIECNSDAKK